MCDLHIFESLAFGKRNVHFAHMAQILDPLLAPMARFLVARGVLFQEFMERMKAHYVRAASQQSARDAKVTDSRISVLTGLQRREITRLRDFTPKQPPPNHLSRLVALWQTEPGYQEAGQARPLAKNGPAPSFEALARLVRKDVHPRTMMDTLVASGTVIAAEDGRLLKLVHTSYQPVAGSDEQVDYLAKNVGDHLNAAAANVLDAGPRHFERAVHYTGLTQSQIDDLRHIYDAAQMDLLRELSQKAAEMKASNTSDGGYRFRAGGFFFDVEEDQK